MSTFPGRLDEIPGISVDQFEDDNMHSKIFFLSHAHTDHMRGLNNMAFSERLKNQQRFIYSSGVTAKIVQLMYPTVAEQVRSLDLNQPHCFQVSPKGIEFTVTLISAGHCPGSVMFLFETEHSRVLYTGDFRLNADDLRRFKGLYSGERLFKKTIDKVYLDTTFLLKRYAQFPTRAESMAALYEAITSWISRGPNYVINLQTGAYYGGEVIYAQVYQHFKEPVHVNADKHSAYLYFPNMDRCVTTSEDAGGSLRIHSHCGGMYKGICQSYEQGSIVRDINISAFSWPNWTHGTNIARAERDTFYRICYSSHASYEELIKFLSFVKPKQIAANVVPTNEADKEEMNELIEEFLRAAV